MRLLAAKILTRVYTNVFDLTSVKENVLMFLLHVSHEGDIVFLWTCPATAVRAVAVLLRRTAACAMSQGAEADVEGFTHLKALEGQPQDERWPLGGKEEGLGLNPTIPLSLPSPPPIPSLSLPSLFSAIASLHISTPVMVCMS